MSEKEQIVPETSSYVRYAKLGAALAISAGITFPVAYLHRQQVERETREKVRATLTSPVAQKELETTLNESVANTLRRITVNITLESGKHVSGVVINSKTLLISSREIWKLAPTGKSHTALTKIRGVVRTDNTKLISNEFINFTERSYADYVIVCHPDRQRDLALIYFSADVLPPEDQINGYASYVPQVGEMITSCGTGSDLMWNIRAGKIIARPNTDTLVTDTRTVMGDAGGPVLLEGKLAGTIRSSHGNETEIQIVIPDDIRMLAEMARCELNKRFDTALNCPQPFIDASQEIPGKYVQTKATKKKTHQNSKPAEDMPNEVSASKIDSKENPPNNTIITFTSFWEALQRGYFVQKDDEYKIADGFMLANPEIMVDKTIPRTFRLRKINILQRTAETITNILPGSSQKISNLLPASTLPSKEALPRGTIIAFKNFDEEVKKDTLSMTTKKGDIEFIEILTLSMKQYLLTRKILPPSA